MRKNLETGIQRLYYVAWASWVAFGIAAFIHDYPHSVYDVLAFLGAFGIAPPLLMYAVRWVYRGFVPHTELR